MTKKELQELNRKEKIVIKTINRKTQQKGVAVMGINENKNYMFIFEGAADGSEDKKQTVEEFLKNYIFFIDYES